MLFRFVIYLSMFFVLSACSLPSSKIPEEHFYRLADPIILKVSTPKFDQLQLANVVASGLYNERAILYRHADKPLALHRYYYHFWLQTPAKLVQDYMSQYLQKSGITKTINTDVNVQPSSTIQTEITRFERVVDKQQITVDVALNIRFSGTSDIYSAQVKADTADMHATVAAVSKALSQIMSQFIKDINRD